MQTIQLICDGCGIDLSTTTKYIDYRLRLEVETVYGERMGETPTSEDFKIKRPIEDHCHFCNLACLDYWSDRRRRKI